MTTLELQNSTATWQFIKQPRTDIDVWTFISPYGFNVDIEATNIGQAKQKLRDEILTISEGFVEISDRPLPRNIYHPLQQALIDKGIITQEEIDQA